MQRNLESTALDQAIYLLTEGKNKCSQLIHEFLVKVGASSWFQRYFTTTFGRLHSTIAFLKKAKKGNRLTGRSLWYNMMTGN